MKLETRNQNQEARTRAEACLHSSFGFRVYFVIQSSSFVISRFDRELTAERRTWIHP
jgi:hypothetical protein